MAIIKEKIEDEIDACKEGIVKFEAIKLLGNAIKQRSFDRIPFDKLCNYLVDLRNELIEREEGMFYDESLTTDENIESAEKVLADFERQKRDGVKYVEHDDDDDDDDDEDSVV